MGHRSLTIAIMDAPYEALMALGTAQPRLTWVNCGLCVDERGAGHVIDGVRLGSPADFFTMASATTTTLVIPTR